MKFNPYVKADIDITTKNGVVKGAIFITVCPDHLDKAWAKNSIKPPHFYNKKTGLLDKKMLNDFVKYYFNNANSDSYHPTYPYDINYRTPDGQPGCAWGGKVVFYYSDLTKALKNAGLI